MLNLYYSLNSQISCVVNCDLHIEMAKLHVFIVLIHFTHYTLVMLHVVTVGVERLNEKGNLSSTKSVVT